MHAIARPSIFRYNHHGFVSVVSNAMMDFKDYVVRENIERFEHLLRSGRLDPRQAEIVAELLAQARRELAHLMGVSRSTGRKRKGGSAVAA